MTSGAKLLTEAAAPYFTRLMVGRSGSGGGGGGGGGKNKPSLTTRWVAVPAAKARRLLDAGAHRSLKSFAWGLSLAGFRRTGAALTLALDNTTLPMVGWYNLNSWV